jgi:ankyrin repeat protein
VKKIKNLPWKKIFLSFISIIIISIATIIFINKNALLEESVWENNIILTKILLFLGADINYSDLPLGNASNSEMVKFLLDNGADVNIKDDIGETALMLASRYGRKNCKTFIKIWS